MKKKLLIGGILLLVGFIGGGVLCGKTFAMPATELWENYSTGVDGNHTIQNNEWYAQTFTASPASHMINGLRIMGYREGEPGTITLSIRGTDDSGLPFGTDLASGTFNGDTVTNSTAGVWCAVALTETSLDYDSVYAIVARAEAGDIDNSFHIIIDASSGNYTGGSVITSDDSGVTWTADTDDDMYFQVYGDATLDVIGAKVFRGYIETGDILIVGEYFNTYAPYYPNAETPDYFYLQLRTSNGATVLAQTTCPAWGLKPGSIYLNADTATMITPGGTYRLYLVGAVTEAPEAYYTITSSDWRGTDLNLLDSWVITTARELADYYGVDMTTYGGTDEILNEQGEVIFATGIPGLQYIRPYMFSVTIYEPGYTEEEPTNAYEEDTTWEEVLGPDASDILTSGGVILGLSGRNAGAAILIAIYLGLCIFIVSRKGDALVGALLGIPIIIAGSRLHLIDIVFVMVMASIGVFFTMYRLWFART